MPIQVSAIDRPDLETAFFELDMVARNSGFIAQRVLPIFNTPSQTGSFGVLPLEALKAQVNTRRAVGSDYPRNKFKLNDATYNCVEYGQEYPLDDSELKNYSNWFELDMISAQMAVYDVLNDQEQRVEDLVFNTTTWSTAALKTSVTNEWDDAANATPREDVNAAINAVVTGSGLRPNAVIMSDKVFRNLKLTDQIVELVKFAGFDDPKNITEQAVADALNVDELIIADQTKNTANSGQNYSGDYVWDDEFAMVAHVIKNRDLRSPGLGRIFHWDADSDSGGTIETYREEKIRSTIYRARAQFDEEILFVESAHLLENITA